MGGVIVPPVDAVASTPAAYRPGKPDFFMAGMVIGPVVSTLETAEPDIMPIRPDETTETFACPPRKRSEERRVGKGGRRARGRGASGERREGAERGGTRLRGSEMARARVWLG